MDKNPFDLFLNYEKQLNAINEKLDKLLANKANEASEIWLNNEQVKSLLGVSTRTLQHYRDNQILKFSQRRRKIYYKQSDIFLYLKAHNIKF